MNRVLADVRNAEAGIQADIAIHGNIPLVHLRVLEVDGVGRPEVRGAVIVDRHAASAGVRVGPRKNWLAVGADVVELADVRSRGAGQGIEDGAENRCRKHTEAGANYGIPVSEGAVGEPNARDEVVAIVFTQTLRQMRLFRGQKGSTWNPGEARTRAR